MEKALILVPHYNNNLCCTASNKPKSQLHYPPPQVTQCLPVHSLSWIPTLPNYGPVQASWVPAYWEEHRDGFQKAEAKRGVLTHRSNRPENRHNWSQHTHHPTTHRPFQSGSFFFFFLTASTKIFIVSFKFPQLAVIGFDLFLIMEKNPGIGSEWRNLSVALPFLKHQCLHEFLSRELDFLSYFALKNEKDKNYFACTESHTET